MKFGHDLVKVISVSEPEWAPFFIQYKLLKKYIKQIPMNGSSSLTEKKEENAISDEKCSKILKEEKAQLEELVESKSEVAFFRVLRLELDKSSRFFQSSEQILEIRRERIIEALRQLKQACADDDNKNDETNSKNMKPTKSVLFPDSGERALLACVAYYRDLILLENYAIVNYCGYSKILKKHDKRTGYQTRARFMNVCVSSKNFSDYPRLLEMIEEAEKLYKELIEVATVVADRLKQNDQIPSALSPSLILAPQSIFSACETGTTSNDTNQYPSHVHQKETLYSASKNTELSPAAIPINNVKEEAQDNLTTTTNLPLTSSTNVPPYHTSSRDLASIRREESDFIDAILNLRSQANRLKAAEDSHETDNDSMIRLTCPYEEKDANKRRRLDPTLASDS
uniref:SPX domain-containing protein n=1 Tax=Aureoumbra lagunensis TaxID=44058 RepID=A0A7S3JRM1_9STRA|mmetsp:Transcript_19192/g.29094  ORF Transcript_19192/g.29094 Transcript_19192/m.29094 type:complete len:398 (+) Transcript_19192:56-1249(+)